METPLDDSAPQKTTCALAPLSKTVAGAWLLGPGPHLPAFVSRPVVGVMLGDVSIDPAQC